jgi:hypothetical protein
MQRRHATLLLGLCLAAAPVYAADEAALEDALSGFDEPAASEPSLDAVLGGFEEETTSGAETAPIAATDRPWRVGGALTLGAAWNYAHGAPAPGETDYRGLSRLRGKLNLEFDAELPRNWRAHVAGYGYYDAAYALNGRDQYTDAVLEEYQSEAELGEAWLRGRLNRQTDLKLGRQIVVWGKSDNIRITDVLNPLDNREPGMVDIEELRLPLTMARLDYYLGDWGLSAMAIPEIRFNKNPPHGSEFFPGTAPLPAEQAPADGGGNTEYALAANGIFSGWDLSLYWAQHFDDSPHLVVSGGTPQLQHSRLTMTGVATNVALGNWLLKGEAAHFSGLAFASLPGESLRRTDTLLGVEYAGFADTTLSLEIANRHLHAYDTALAAEGLMEDEWQSALRYQGDFLHARLHLLALVTAFGEKLSDGGFGRYSVAYDLADALTLTGGIVSYEGGEKLPFNRIGDNDRLFVDLKYSF